MGSVAPVQGQKAVRVSPAAGQDQVCLSCHEGMNSAAAAPESAPKLPSWGGEGSNHLLGRPGARKMDAFERTVRANGRTITVGQGCGGCHDPHGKERGRLRATAFDARGQWVDRKPQFVAEVCFGCHAGPEAVALTHGPSDIGQLFTRGIASGHGLGATAASRPELPSLRTSAFQGKVDCTSCHDNPDPAGARGPHSSSFPSLLKAGFGREKDLARLGVRANDLCYLCHDRQSIATNQSFAYHGQHMTGFTQSGSGAPRRAASSGLAEASAMLGVRSAKDLRPGRGGAYLPGYGEPSTCATCHAAHGSMREAALIEFDRAVVSPSSMGGVSFQRSGLGHGTCTLTCHGYDHVQTRY
jgi:hypothetical protein